jgi:hypothetical protein
VSEPLRKASKPIEPGYAEWAYNEENAERLYDVSLKLVGLE